MVDAILAATILSGVPDPRLASGDRALATVPGGTISTPVPTASSPTSASTDPDAAGIGFGPARQPR